MGRMLTAVRAALRGRVSKDPRDAAAERLALAYAELVDAAAPAAKYRKAVAALGRAAALYTGDDADEVGEAYETVAQALAEHSVASDLGPKLLAVLTSLGLTTAGRGAAKDGGKREPARNPIDEIRARREQRNTR